MFKKRKNLLSSQLLIRELERLFINNPIDAPSAEIDVEEYRGLIKVAKLMTSHYNFPLTKDSREWSYLATKWNSLHNFRAAVEQLNSFNTYHDIFSAILGDWDNLKQSPYTYRCVASLIRMLGEE